MTARPVDLGEQLRLNSNAVGRHLATRGATPTTVAMFSPHEKAEHIAAVHGRQVPVDWPTVIAFVRAWADARVGDPTASDGHAGTHRGLGQMRSIGGGR